MRLTIVALILFGAVIVIVVGLTVVKKILGIGPYRTADFKILPSSFQDWEHVFRKSANIKVEVLHAGNVTGTVYGLINLKDKKELGIADEKLVAPLLSILIQHDQFGSFLIDSGFDRSFSERPCGNFAGMAREKVFHFSAIPGTAIEEQLAERNITLRGVFCTHFHEHQGGAPSLPNDIPFVFGKGEKEICAFPFVYAQFLKDKSKLQTIDFTVAEEMPLVGKAVDVFGDGSFWAISTPGHTQGHVSYLVNGVEGQYLIMGDICMCRMGFDLGLESGGRYAENLPENQASFLKMKRFLDTYPQIKPVFGHESPEFPIHYEAESKTLGGSALIED